MNDRALPVLTLALAAATSAPLRADVISFNQDDFTVTPVFSPAPEFTFTIDVAATLQPGSYVNPPLNEVSYRVRGSLAAGTPSGFAAFDLVRTITGAEFYAQGSSLSFIISPDADLTDGVQPGDLGGSGVVLRLNAREVGTGRYHPPLVVLNGAGNGSIRNSNNSGGINPATLREVDVDFGDEYVSNLAFTPGTAAARARAVPVGAGYLSAIALVLGGTGLGYRRRARA